MQARQKRSFFLLMLTLFSVLVVPMSFLFLGLYSSTFSMVHTDYLEMNTQLSHTISQQVDTYLYARMNFAFYLSQSRAAQKLAAQVEDSYEDATEIFRQLASSMAAIQSYDNVFSMAAIYFPKRGEICATNGVRADSELYYNNHLAIAGESAESFYQKVVSVEESAFFPAVLSSPSSRGSSRVIPYVQSLSMGYIESRAYFITFLNESALLSQVMRVFGEDARFVLLDAQGNTLTATTDADPAWQPRDLDHWETVANGLRYHAFCTDSASTGLKYLYFLPESKVLRQLGSFRAIWFALLAVSLAVGFLLARRVAKQLYTPVRALMAKAFPQGTSANPRNIQEEYRLITDEVQRTQERSRQFQQELKEHYQATRQNMLFQLLTQSNRLSEERRLDAAKLCGLPTEEAVYQVAVATMEHSPALDWGKDLHVLEYRLSGAQMVYVAAFSPRAPQAFAQKLAEWNPGGHGIVVGVSRVYPMLRELSTCFSEASAACAHFRPENAPYLEYSDMLTDASTIYYPAEIELQILTAVRAGEMEQTVLLLEEIRDKNEQRTLVPEMMRCLQYNLAATALKALSSDDIHKDSMSAAIRLLTMLGHEHLSLEEAFDKLRVLYVQLCLDSMEANQSKNERVMARILDYLQENHADSSLGLDSVAERFGVSYYYLSRLFKEEVGKGFSELVNEIRVRHAMHLLTETSEPIQSIAQQVGYNNWSTFLRAFRKIAGVTPLQYRQNHAGNP